MASASSEKRAELDVASYMVSGGVVVCDTDPRKHRREDCYTYRFVKRAFALPVKINMNESNEFFQVVKCFVDGQRIRYAADSDFSFVDAMNWLFLQTYFEAVCA